MAILVDTCVLIPTFHRQASDHATVRTALGRLTESGETLIVTPQIVAEFWIVSTRPIENDGRGLGAHQVRTMVNIICRICRVEYESPRSFVRWRELVERHEVRGVAVHDARLVGVLLANGMRGILTRNETDFKRYEKEGVTVLTPQSVATGSV